MERSTVIHATLLPHGWRAAFISKQGAMVELPIRSMCIFRHNTVHHADYFVIPRHSATDVSMGDAGAEGHQWGAENFIVLAPDQSVTEHELKLLLEEQAKGPDRLTQELLKE